MKKKENESFENILAAKILQLLIEACLFHVKFATRKKCTAHFKIMCKCNRVNIQSYILSPPRINDVIVYPLHDKLIKETIVV